MVAVASDNQDLGENIVEILNHSQIDCAAPLASFWELHKFSRKDIELLIYCCSNDPLGQEFLWYLLHSQRYDLKRLLLVHDASKVEHIEKLQLPVQIPFEPVDLISNAKHLL